jgi:hypothetical protein
MRIRAPFFRWILAMYSLLPHLTSTILLAVIATHAEPAPPLAARLAQSAAAPGQPVSINSHGFQITGRFFSGEGGGPRPTLVLLPGWPGRTGDVLGLGGRLSDARVNVLMVIRADTAHAGAVKGPSTWR